MNLKKNDNVLVVTGKDKGKRGKILLVDAKKDTVIVEGINKKKKFTKASQENPKGGVLNIEFPVNASNVMYFCEKCKKGVRLGTLLKQDSKERVCKKCGKSID